MQTIDSGNLGELARLAHQNTYPARRRLIPQGIFRRRGIQAGRPSAVFDWAAQAEENSLTDQSASDGVCIW